MVGVLASGGVKSWVRAQSGQTKDHEIGICCFSTKHSALGVKSKNGWLEVRIMPCIYKWKMYFERKKV
jgi:hypothetical protein